MTTYSYTPANDETTFVIEDDESENAWIRSDTWIPEANWP